MEWDGHGGPGAMLKEENPMVPRALVVQSRPDVARAVSASLADGSLMRFFGTL